MKAPFRGGRTAFVSQGLASSGNFLLSVLLIRALGLEKFGVLSLVLIVVGYAAGLCQALVCQPLLSLASIPNSGSSAGGAGDGRAGRVGEALPMALCLALLLGGLAWGLALWLERAGAGALGITATGCAALVAVRVLAPALRSGLFVLGNGPMTVALDVVGTWGACAGLVAYGRWSGLDMTVASVLTVLVAASGTACMLGLLGVRRQGVALLQRPGRHAWARHWKSGRWLAANQALSWFGSGGFHAATAMVLGPAGVGAVRAAQSLVGVLLVGCQALDLVLPGRAAAALSRGGPAQLALWARGQARVLGCAFAALGIVLALGAPWVVRALFPGVDPKSTELALVGLCWLPAASVVAGVLQVGLRAVENTRPVFLAYAVSALTSGALALPIVQAFGLPGAAGGLAASQGLFAVLLWVAYGRAGWGERTLATA